MDSELGFINIDSIAVLDNYFLSQQIEKRFLHWMDVAKKHTVKLVDKHWSIIEALALKLIEQEIVESDELSQIVGKEKVLNNMPDSL
jgi:cell division protease FtsH